MAATKNVAGDVTNKKNKGLKDHKKLQKEMSLAKRNALAEKFKFKQTSSSPTPAVVAKGSAPVREKVVQEVDVASVDNTKPIVEEPAAAETPSSVAFDTIAHRKALEAALYENMETSRQMFHRCRRKASVDSEYQPKDKYEDRYDVFDDLDFADLAPKVKCRDDNGFDFAPPFTGSTVNNTSSGPEVCRLPSLEEAVNKIIGSKAPEPYQAPATPDVEVVHDSEKKEPENIGSRLPPASEAIHKPLSIDQLFSAAPINGKIIYTATQTEMKARSGSKSLETVEAEMRATAPDATHKPISIDQLFSATSADGGKITAASQIEKKGRIGSKTLEDVEAEMRAAAQFTASRTIPSNAPHLVDSAIASYKIKAQDSSEAHNLTVYTARTGHEHTGISPPSLSSSSNHSRASSMQSDMRPPTPSTPWHPLGLLSDAIRWNPSASSYNANWRLPLFSHPGGYFFPGPNAAIGSHGDLGNTARGTWDYSGCLQYDLERKWAADGHSRSHWGMGYGS